MKKRKVRIEVLALLEIFLIIGMFSADFTIVETYEGPAVSPSIQFWICLVAFSIILYRISTRLFPEKRPTMVKKQEMPDWLIKGDI